MKKNIAIIALPVAVISSLALAAEGAPEKKRIPQNALIIDVRTPAEYEAGHYPGARNIPLDSVLARISEFGPKDGVVVVYCRSGRRSGIAQRFLEKAGYENAINGGGLVEMMQRFSSER